MTLNEKIQLARDELENAMESVPTSTKEAFLRLSKLLTELDEQSTENKNNENKNRKQNLKTHH